MVMYRLFAVDEFETVKLRDRCLAELVTMFASLCAVVLTRVYLLES
jgi:hypothetical protein